MLSTAQWIWTKEDPSSSCHFVFFRRLFRVDSHIRIADLRISADSKYRLWLNDKYVGTGPARGKPGVPYVDSYAVKSLLCPGVNTIAVLVEHYSSGSIIFSPVHGGLVAELTINGKPVLCTDGDWKCHNAESYSVPSAGYQHLEVFDANLYPQGWRKPEFNDNEWHNPVLVETGILAAPQQLPDRPIPALTSKIYSAKSIIALGYASSGMNVEIENLPISLRDMKRTRFFDVESIPAIKNPVAFPSEGITITPSDTFFIEIDMGKEVLGTPRFSIDTEVSTSIDIGYSEVLENNQVNPFRQNIFFAERIITRPGKNEHTVFQPRGFRYLLMRFNTDERVQINSVEVIEEIYPAQRNGHFNSSDKALNNIFKMCQRTMNLCMEDAFTDCPWRERQQWLGDLLVEFKTALYALGATDMCRKALMEFCEIKTGEGWMYSVAPGGAGLNLPTFGMYFPFLVWDYYLFTGEKAVLEHCYETIKELADFLQTICRDGLILTRNLLSQENLWHFLDWTKTDTHNGDGALQGLYLSFLQLAGKIAHTLELNEDKQCFAEKALQTEQAILRGFWSKEKRAFLKYRLDGSTLPPGTPPQLLGQHENFLFPLLNVGTRRQQNSALEAIQGLAGRYLPDLGGMQSYFSDDQCGSVADKSIIMLGSPFFSYFALASLYAAGKNAEALEYIKICWGFMLDNGPGTCWEMWGGGTSRCHGFSTAPAYFFYTEILGISAQEPGFRKIRLKPRSFIPESAEGIINLVQGPLKFGWQQNPTEVKIRLEVPQQSEAHFHIPEGYECEDEKRSIFQEGTHSFVVRQVQSRN